MNAPASLWNNFETHSMWFPRSPQLHRALVAHSGNQLKHTPIIGFSIFPVSPYSLTTWEQLQDLHLRLFWAEPKLRLLPISYFCMKVTERNSRIFKDSENIHLSNFCDEITQTYTTAT